MLVAAGRESPEWCEPRVAAGRGRAKRGEGLGRTGGGGGGGGTPRSSERCPALLPNFGEEPRGEAAANNGCERAGE